MLTTVGHTVEQRLERAAQADRPESSIAQPRSDHRQAIRLAALGAERLDDGDPVEALVHGLAELAEFFLSGVVELVDASLVREVERDQQREHRHSRQTQPDVGDQQPHRREDEHQHDAGGKRQRVQHMSRCLCIDAGTGDDVAGSLLPMPRHRLGDDTLDDLGGQRLGHTPGRATGKHAPSDHADGTNDTDDHQQPEDADDAAGGDVSVFEPRHDDLVDDEADDDGRKDGARGVDRRTADRGEEQALVVPQQAADQPECLGAAGSRQVGRFVAEFTCSGSIRAARHSTPEYAVSSCGAVALSPVNQFNVGLLILRAVFGLFLAYHGYNKFFGPGGLSGTAGWFDSIGMRWPQWQARLAATTEIGSGVLMALGFLTPLAAAGMIGVMTVAIVVAHWKVGFFIFKESGLGVLRFDRGDRIRHRHGRARALVARPCCRHRLARVDRCRHRRSCRTWRCAAFNWPSAIARRRQA